MGHTYFIRHTCFIWRYFIWIFSRNSQKFIQKNAFYNVYFLTTLTINHDKCANSFRVIHFKSVKFQDGAT